MSSQPCRVRRGTGGAGESQHDLLDRRRVDGFASTPMLRGVGGANRAWSPAPATTSGVGKLRASYASSILPWPLARHACKGEARSCEISSRSGRSLRPANGAANRPPSKRRRLEEILKRRRVPAEGQNAIGTAASGWTSMCGGENSRTSSGVSSNASHACRIVHTSGPSKTGTNPRSRPNGAV